MTISREALKWIFSKADNKLTVSKSDSKWSLSMDKPYIPHAGGIGYWRIEYEFKVQ